MEQYTDYIGYIASGVVLLSFLMRKMIFLRIVNTIGCVFFIVYGILLGEAPIIITNAAIVLINIYYLSKSNKES
ncbi:MAG: uroporphyrinogen decarboxylase [Crocinitomicaceae bacterium]|nr:MAG: uroporphyrinogen decarboxylase [Crocinitomicaceae bacterium]